jgi:diaminohydroxyphosphoribosylaminopyrimidine deaminase/5-amino-6-(5-phosphoribosylamino)uracil reductase
MSADEQWMERALGLARRAWGETHPNPLVGALIVEEGAVVAHEEAEAMEQMEAEVMIC